MRVKDLQVFCNSAVKHVFRGELDIIDDGNQLHVYDRDKNRNWVYPFNNLNHYTFVTVKEDDQNE